MFRKIFLSILLLFVVSINACADIFPYKTEDIPIGTLGVYQANNSLKLFAKPDKKSDVIFDKTWSYLSITSSDYADNLFAILKEKKELSYLYVTDIDEEFVQVIYNKKNNTTGWASKLDEFQFLPWITFYNMYGKKYGLKVLKGVPTEIYNLHSASSADSQILERLNYPKEIRLTTIQGNWALITALDIDNQPKTGFIKWRGDNGELYLFPVIK